MVWFSKMLPVALCVFLLPLGFGTGNQIAQNFKDLFDAVATKNDTKRHELEEALHGSQREQEEAYDTLRDALKSSIIESKQRYQSSSIKRNVTIKRAVKSDNNVVFDREFEEKSVRNLLKHAPKTRQLGTLINMYVDLKEEHFRLSNIIGRIGWEKATAKSEALFYKMLMGMRNRVDQLLNLLWPRDIPCPNSRFYQLMFLFVIGNGNYYVQQLRELVNQCGMNLEQFSMYLQNVYRDDANQPVHTIKVPPCTPAEIEGACAAAKFELEDDMTKPILRVLFCKLNQTKAPDGKILIPTNEADNQYRCLVLANVPYQPREEKEQEAETENPKKPKPEDLMDQSIEEKLRTQFFEKYITEKKLIEKIERLDKPVIEEGSLPNRRSFLIKFYNVHDALDAFLKHMKKPFAEEKRIGISVRNCNNLYTDNLDEIIRPRPPIPKIVSVVE